MDRMLIVKWVSEGEIERKDKWFDAKIEQILALTSHDDWGIVTDAPQRSVIDISNRKKNPNRLSLPTIFRKKLVHFSRLNPRFASSVLEFWKSRRINSIFETKYFVYLYEKKTPKESFVFFFFTKASVSFISAILPQKLVVRSLLGEESLQIEDIEDKKAFVDGCSWTRMKPSKCTDQGSDIPNQTKHKGNAKKTRRCTWQNLKETKTKTKTQIERDCGISNNRLMTKTEFCLFIFHAERKKSTWELLLKKSF